MKILKRLNFLDWIIIAAFLLTVFAAIYSLSPFDREEKYIMEIRLNEKADIKKGDICSDADNGKQIGKVSIISENKFFVEVKGKKAEHGLRVNRRIYLKNMPLRLYIGDFYAEAKLEGLSFDS